jgi:hypothetical protein
MGTLFLKWRRTRWAWPLILAQALALPAGATEDTDTPGPARWEINIGALQEHKADTWVRSLPDVEVNYGLGAHLQLMAALPYVTVREQGEPGRSGWGNASAGVKWRMLDQDAAGLDLAMFPQFGWNPASSTARRGLGSPGRSLLLPLIAGQRYGDTAWYAELGRNLVERGPHEWQAGLKLVHQCLPQLECRVELEHSRVPRDGGQTTASAGAKWRLAEQLVLQGRAGRDIAGARDGRRRLVLYLGVQLLL